MPRLRGSRLKGGRPAQKLSANAPGRVRPVVQYAAPYTEVTAVPATAVPAAPVQGPENAPQSSALVPVAQQQRYI
eukprot:5944385-Amphidinium_carterae.1